jgi:outer membrane protein TolC
MIRPYQVFPLILVASLAACIGTVETGPPPPSMPSMGPNPEAAERILNTMKEKIAAAEALVVLREESLKNVENQLQAGRQTSIEVDTVHAQLWDARIRALNYKQELYTAQASMPRVLETMREKLVAAEKVVEIREEIAGVAEALTESGTQTAEELASIRSDLLEDRIRALNYQQDLIYAEAIFGMSREAGNVK